MPAAGPEATPALVDDSTVLAALIERLAPVGAVAFDLEFLSQDRLAPTLCLVQLAWREADAVEVRLVDPLAVDVRPLIALLADGRTVIAHGARQDAGLVAAQFDVRVARLFDTQIAAAFVGIGDQIGYARLAQALVGAAIDKDSQWTDWDRRPLSPRQLRYAIADVAHLPAIHDVLAGRLGERLPWVLAEGADMVGEAWDAARLGADDAWRAIGGARSLDRPALAALIELAAWRHRTAVAENLPLGHVAADRTLIELARARPPDARALRKVRGANELRDRDAAVIAVVAAGAARAERGDIPDLGAAPGPSTPRVQLWTEIVLAVVADVAEATGIAPRFLATRADAEALCRAIDRAGSIDGVEHRLLTTWRHAVIGDRLARWFRGNAALTADLTVPAGINLR
jgi:ribonuclease D